jgi:hypothetical protein
MSKLGRNRKGRGWQAKRTNWQPVQPDGEVRHEIHKKKSRSGVEYIVYKPVTLLKDNRAEGDNRAYRRKLAKLGK